MATENDKDDLATITADLKTAKTGFEAATVELKTFADKAREELAANKTLSAETKTSVDEGLLKMGELTTRIMDLEQKSARLGGLLHGGPRAPELKTLGQTIIENEEVKSRLLAGTKKGMVSFEIETKAITSGTSAWGSTVSATNSLVMADRQPGIVGIPMRPMTIRDLVAPGNTSSNAVEYVVQTTRTNNAAVVAEGALKPLSAYAFDLRSFPVRTIAHLVKASRQILDDAPALASIIDAEMRYGLAFAEETELLYGDGTGVHILGLQPQAVAYSQPFTEPTGATPIDRIRMAMLQSVQALLPVTGVVLNPLDWTRIEMVKDAAGRYIIGDPQGTIAPRLWGLPVVPSLALTSGTFLTGSFAQAAQVFDRMAVEILISTENNDDFEKNMVTIRCEERLAFVVKRPAAFVTGALP